VIDVGNLEAGELEDYVGEDAEVVIEELACVVSI